MRAKQNNRIVVSLEKPLPEKLSKPDKKSGKKWESVLKELSGKAKKLKGSADSPSLYSPAFSLVKASLEFAQNAVSEPIDEDGLHKALKKVRRALNKSITVLNRMEER